MTKKSDEGKVSVFTVKDPKFVDTEFFDDCPICQAMKKAEEEGINLSEEELKELKPDIIKGRQGDKNG